MELVKQFVRQYWPNGIALTFFLAALFRYVRLAQWEEHLVPFASAAFGFVCVVASDEVADCTGSYGWTRQQWRQCPTTFVRIAGGLALVFATLVLYRR